MGVGVTSVLTRYDMRSASQSTPSTRLSESNVGHTHADIWKVAELIGYIPSRDIRDGVSEFINWYEQNTSDTSRW